jgi:hypothetical protein
MWQPCPSFKNDYNLIAESDNGNQVYLTVLYEMRYLIGDFNELIFPKIVKNEVLSKNSYHPALKGVGHINLKKLDEGETTTYQPILRKHVKLSKELIRRQLSAIDMDIILCHGAYILDYLTKIVFKNENNEIKQIDEKLWLLSYDTNKSFLIFVLPHPSRQKHKSVLNEFKIIADDNKEYIINYLNKKGRITSLNWLT